MRSSNFFKSFALGGFVATVVSGAALAADKPKPIVPVTPPPPAGHEWNLLFGATITSQYISKGAASSEGVAFQPWAELDIGPVYLGYWGSNVSPSLASGASWEHDLSIGIRGTHGPVSWDVGYVRFLYDTYDGGGEIYAKGSISPSDGLTLGAAIAYSPEGAYTYIEGNAKLVFHDNMYASGAVGSKSGVFSWNAGVGWTPHPWLTLDGRYYGGPSGGTANKFVVSASFATDWKTVSGGGY